jgi:hypothetical protein
MFSKHYRTQVARGAYSGSIEDYAEHIERVRMGCGRADSWAAWVPRPTRTPRVGKYSHLTDAEYYRLKYSERVEFRLQERMRRQFKKWLRGDRVAAPSFLGTLTYTWEELRLHLEALFQPGMSWTNFGQWHVDHVRPKALFDPRDPEQARACWALSNLRPLWQLDNLKRPKDGSDVLRGS